MKIIKRGTRKNGCQKIVTWLPRGLHKLRRAKYRSQNTGVSYHCWTLAVTSDTIIIMRSWSCALALIVVIVSVECQRRNQGGTQPAQGDRPVRIGLVSSDLGLPPVPGGNPGHPVRPNQPTGCFCIPANQACPGQPISPNKPNTSGPAFDVRIANRPGPQGACTNAEEKVCCLSSQPGFPQPQPFPVGPQPRPPQPQPFPVRPNPVVPNPVQIGGSGSCGVSNPIPYRQAQFAEAQFGEYPWMTVILDLGNGYLGGGVLIASDWVLTAAHKVQNIPSLKVRLGELNVRKPQDHPQFEHLEVRIDNVIIHPNFDTKTLANDVALLHLSQPVNTQAYPHIGTACLPEQGQLFQGQSCWVTGFGKDAFEKVGSFQEILKEVDVPVVDSFVCQERLRETRLGHAFTLDRFSFVCAGGVAGKDACTGDGGAPLVCRTNRGWTVAGLVAWGIGCATSEVPGVYVNVPNYVNFIRQYVRT